MVSAVCLAASLAQGAEEAVKKLAGTLLEQHASALVMLEAEITIQPLLLEAPEAFKETIKEQLKTQTQYSTTKSPAVVIDDSGLVAAPLMMLNPPIMMDEITTIDSPFGPIRIGASASFDSVKLLMGDGTEQVAEVVLVDRTTGLALIKVESPEGLTSVELAPEGGATVLSPFDPVLVCSRMDEHFGMNLVCYTGRFLQQLPGPGALFENAGGGWVAGGAVFDRSERLVGIVVMMPSGAGSAMGHPYVLPSARIAQLAQNVMKKETK